MIRSPSSAGGLAALYLGDEVSARRLYVRAVGLLRRIGAIGLLATALDRLAFSEALAGRLADAWRCRQRSGASSPVNSASRTRPRWRCSPSWKPGAGRQTAAGIMPQQALAQAEARRLGAVAAGACWALGLLDLGMGRPAEALARLAPMVAGHGLSHPTIALWAIPDLVEAAARAGNAQAGRAPLERFSAWTQRTGAPWSIAVAHRGAALLGGGDLGRFGRGVGAPRRQSPTTGPGPDPTLFRRGPPPGPPSDRRPRAAEVGPGDVRPARSRAVGRARSR